MALTSSKAYDLTMKKRRKTNLKSIQEPACTHQRVHTVTYRTDWQQRLWANDEGKKGGGGGEEPACTHQRRRHIASSKAYGLTMTKKKEKKKMRNRLVRIRGSKMWCIPLTSSKAYDLAMKERSKKKLTKMLWNRLVCIRRSTRWRMALTSSKAYDLTMKERRKKKSNWGSRFLNTF